VRIVSIASQSSNLNQEITYAREERSLDDAEEKSHSDETAKAGNACRCGGNAGPD